MMGMSASGKGRFTIFPNHFAYFGCFGCTATATSAIRVSGRVVEISMNSPGLSASSYFMVKSFEREAFMITSSSERAVRETGHQFTIRLPR